MEYGERYVMMDLEITKLTPHAGRWVIVVLYTIMTLDRIMHTTVGIERLVKRALKYSDSTNGI